MKTLNSNMSGTVMRFLVNVGDKVSLDQDVVVIESMKMEMNVAATDEGTVTEIVAKVEDFVQEGEPLLRLK